MRIIKFRAWDETKKKMFSAEEMGRDELSLSVDGRGFFNPDPVSQKLTQYFPHLIPLQFTGLHDKAGTPIYEGDVVEWLDRKGVVAFKDGEFIANWDKEASSFNERLRVHCGSLTVVGNIYEQPEAVKS